MLFDISRITWKKRFFYQTSQWKNKFTIVINEFSIKVDEIQKTLYVFDVDEWKSFDNSVDFDNIHFDIFCQKLRRDNESCILKD